MSAPTYRPPADARLAQWFDGLDDDAKEFFQERAAMREHLAGFGREQAEDLAWAETQGYLARRNARPR